MPEQSATLDLVELARRFFDSIGRRDLDAEEIRDLGSGVTFGVVLQKGRPVGSSGHVQMRTGAISVRASGVQVRSRLYTDIAEARAAAERVAESRG
jgi:hypothetical protein